MFDLIVFSVKQSEDSLYIPNNTNIYLELGQVHHISWPFIASSDGVWYSLLAESNDIAGTRICEHLSWDCNISIEWVDKRRVEELTPYSIASEYFDSYTEILGYLVNHPPVKMV